MRVVQGRTELHLGFTGTKVGMTTKQIDRLRKLFELCNEVYFGTGHHGDCVGADKEFHDIACQYGWKPVIHPPKNSKYRAFCQSEFVWPEKDYIARNHDIVNTCERLLAAPKSNTEELRSGTWATIRYARKIERPVWIIWPNGAITA